MSDHADAGWPGRLLDLARGLRAPLWAVAALTVAFVLLGGLSAVWAAVGLLALVAAVAATAHVAAGYGTHSHQTVSPNASAPAARDHVWRAMLDGLPDAAIILDASQQVLASNSPARSTFEVETGRPISRFIRAPDLLSAIDRALAGGQGQTCDVTIRTPVERSLSGTVMPLGGESEGEPAVLIVLRDRTESERLADMRVDFIANASHELRTPLASLKGFIETLQGAARDDPKAREHFLAIMEEQASRMARLIEDLLSLSRIEMQEHVTPTATVDIGAIVQEAITSMAPQAEAASIALRMSPANGPMLVVGDRDELAQVIQNLIQNAIKYGRTGGTVDVSVSQVDRRIALVVADDGIGIAPTHIPRLTERFYRVSAQESRARGGTGLGLAIVKHIVNRHRGELRIDSELGRGSTFTVLLPAASGG